MPPIRRINLGEPEMLQTKLITDIIKNVKTYMSVTEFGYHKCVKRERDMQLISLNGAAFSYDVSIDYSNTLILTLVMENFL